MNDNNNVCAIVPLRKGSKRVKRKNIKDFAGKPLFTVILDTLKQTKQVKSVVVDTNYPEVKKIIKSDYPNIKIIDRLPELSSEYESVNNIIKYDLQYIEEDIILQTHATNPLVKPETFEEAISTFNNNLDKHDALFSVTRIFERFWDEDGEPINHDPNVLIRTQDLPPMYAENSCIYLFTKEGFEQAGDNRLGTNRMMYEMDPYESVDIDYPIDFKFAELIYKEK